MAVTYSISGGADAAKFNINSTSGALTFKTAPDFEKPGSAAGSNVYKVQVKATDPAGGATTQDLTVTVTDVAETVANVPPQFTSSAMVSVAENTTAAGIVVAIDPDAAGGGGGGGGGGGTPLTPSGSITVSANNQIVENKEVTGQIVVANKSGVIIRNCHIKHPGDVGIFAQSCNGLTIEGCKLTNTQAATGQRPNPNETKNIEMWYSTGTTTLKKLTLIGSCGVYAYKCGDLALSFLEGINHRGPGDMHRGQLVQFNQCAGSITMEDFYCKNEIGNSWCADNVSIYNCTGRIEIRRGLIDGNDEPDGVGVMVENGTTNVLVEDVDLIHMMNGAVSVYDASNNNIYRRIRVKDTYLSDQGRGSGSSNNLTYCSYVDCSGTRFEQCKHWNVRMDNVFWHGDHIAVEDSVAQDFTPRAPIKNVFSWE